jgi:hypothetical protein
MKYAALIVQAAVSTSRSHYLEQLAGLQNPMHPTLLVQQALEGFLRLNLTVCQIFS